jgi:D-beta-D-heptose 7-phosphate kinase/D-beta-D-heptose 1-phosphate adenosyltransferase
VNDPELASILERFPGRRVLVVGDLMLDEYLWGVVRRISQEAPVPVVELRQRSHAPGGAANTAANVAGLQARAILAGVVGRDEAGKQLRAALHERRICTEGVFQDDRPTSTKTRIVAHSQQVVRVDQEQCGPLALALEERLLAFIADALPAVDACILADYSKSVISARLAQHLIQSATRLGKPVVVDPKGIDCGKYRGATVVKPNLHEASLFLRREVSSEEDILEAGRRLLDLLAAGAVLLTRGPAGMSLFAPGSEPAHIPAQAREVFDVTGAGDTVAGTLGVALAAGADMEQAARLSSRAASIVVGRVGTSAIRLDELR